MARVCYSFTAGLFVYRNRLIIRNRGGLVLTAMLLLACLLMPFYSLNWLIESVLVLLVFPVIISLGAGTQVETRLQPLVNWLGNISYPLYMTHYWALWFFGDWLNQPGYSPSQLPYIIPLGVVFLVAFAHIVMKLADMPIRAYLKAKFLPA